MSFVHPQRSFLPLQETLDSSYSSETDVRSMFTEQKARMTERPGLDPVRPLYRITTVGSRPACWAVVIWPSSTTRPPRTVTPSACPCLTIRVSPGLSELPLTNQIVKEFNSILLYNLKIWMRSRKRLVQKYIPVSELIQVQRDFWEVYYRFPSKVLKLYLHACDYQLFQLN